MANIFVKAHKRAGKIVSAYSRKGSAIKAQRSLQKIANALARKAGGVPDRVSQPLKRRAYDAYSKAARLGMVQVNAKRSAGAILLNRNTERNSAYKTVSRNKLAKGMTFEGLSRSYSSRNLIGPKTPIPGFRMSTLTVHQPRWVSQNVIVGGAFSTYPKGTRIDAKGLTDPYGRYHRRQQPKKRR